MHTDEVLDQIVPTYLALTDLTPPDQWVTQWDSIRCLNEQPINSALRITELDGQVITHFPQSTTQLKHGGSFTSEPANPNSEPASSSSIPFKVHEQIISQLLSQQQKDMQKFLQEAKEKMLKQMTQFQISNVQVNPQEGFKTETSSVQFPIASVCDHPHCSKEFCQFQSDLSSKKTDQSRFRLNMFNFVSSKSENETY